MKKNIIKNKRGMTLVELIVSMGIFAVVMTMTVGFFITTQKMQMTYRDRANLQQEGRIASEIFSRYVREAKTVAITGTDVSGGKEICNASGGITLLMNDGTTSTNGTTLKFICSGTIPNTLKMASCPSPCTPSAFSDISSSQVNIASLTIGRGAQATYPKTLTYSLEADQYKKDASGNMIPSASLGVGEKITFPGYLVMRNEL